MDNSDAMRQALTQCPVLLMRHRKSLPTGSPTSLRGEEASRTSPAENLFNTGHGVVRLHSSPRQTLRELPSSRTFPSRARSASPPGSEAVSAFFAEPRSPVRASSPEERNSKVRGLGHVNYRRSIGSAGIPWRQIPNLDRPSSALEPREGDGAERLRRAGQFSPKLATGEGMRDILGASVEGSLFKTPPPSEAQKEAGSDMAKPRADGKMSPTAGGRFVRLDFGDVGGKEAGSAEKPPLHFAYKQMKKGVNHELVDTKDSCPFHREDAPGAREDAATDPSCSPKRRSRAVSPHSPQANLFGSGAVPKTDLAERIGFVPEKVQESRRDWQVVSTRKSLPARTPAAFNGLSPNLSPRTLMAIEKPIHSIRQRATLGGGKLWK